MGFGGDDGDFAHRVAGADLSEQKRRAIRLGAHDAYASGCHQIKRVALLANPEEILATAPLDPLGVRRDRTQRASVELAKECARLQGSDYIHDTILRRAGRIART